MRIFAWAGVVALAGVVGCNPSRADDGGGGSGTSSASTGGGTKEAASVASFTVTLQHSLELADVLFRFDPDLDPNGSADANNQKIQENAVEAGGGDAGCVSVTLVGEGLRVDFGMGCVLGNGSTASGAVVVKVSKPGASGLKVDLTFESLVYDGIDLDGALGFTVTNPAGSEFDVIADLTHSGTTVTADIHVVGDPTSIAVDGAGTVKNAGVDAAIAVSGLVVVPADCYPKAGVVTGTSGPISASLTFDANTPTTGQATQKLGPIQSCVALPAHGACMPTACP